MMRKWLRRSGMVLVLLVGVVVGVAVASGSPKSSANTTRTVMRTATVVRTRVPVACVRALHDLRVELNDEAQLGLTETRLLQLVGRDMQQEPTAFTGASLERLLARIRAFGSDARATRPAVALLAADAATAAAHCE